MASITKFTPHMRKKFLAALAEMPNVARACRMAGVSRVCVYDHRESDAEFASEWEDALQDGIELLEQRAWERAQTDSDTLTIFLLKAHKPDKYRETVRNEHTGADGGPIKLEDVRQMSDAELHEILEGGSSG